MSVPLDRLYHYIESIANKVHGDVVISRFWPHGSKNLENLHYLRDMDWYHAMITPNIVCHDQEPLNFDYYQTYPVEATVVRLETKYQCRQPINIARDTIFDKTVLLHSEKESCEVDKYQVNNFIPVYYWSHALIALDWYRFAQHVQIKKKTKKTFLIYNRAWSGTREYRIKFVEFIHLLDLVGHCQTTFNSVDPETGIDYRDHVFKNTSWRPLSSLSNQLTSTAAPSCSSADFDLSDYENTDIEVVLETLFDDSRIHLTEKILRPIACGQPFILAATGGSLDYLQNYGFKTYGSVWNETYDTIADPAQRLLAIATLMKEIANWDSDTRNKKLAQAQEIADYNKKYFFSKEFVDLVTSELTTNLQQGLDQLLLTNTSSVWLTRHRERCQFPELKNILIGRTLLPEAASLDTLYLNTLFKTNEVIKVLHEARKYYLRSLSACTQNK